MSALNFLMPLYESQHSRESLLQHIDEALVMHGLSAKVIPFFSQFSASDWIQQSNLFGRTVSLIHSGEGVSQLEHILPEKPAKALSLSDDRDSIYEYDRIPPSVRTHHALLNNRFFIYEHPTYPHVCAFVTLGATDTFEYLHRSVLKAYPNLVTTFITHRTLHRLLEAFNARHALTDIVIKRASVRIRFGDDGDQDERKQRVVPLVTWPQMGLQDAFSWVYQQNGWFQSLQFDARQDHRTLATISFTRQGITKTTGLFSQVFNSFVEPVCKRIYENVELFKQRSRREQKGYLTRPLVIDFESEQIGENDERRRFVRAMLRLQRASVSVLHGNPYVHLSVLDYYDGSTFDIWVLSEKEIAIVPQMKATVAAIKRLVQHIFDSYGEGHIKDYEGSQHERSR